jgi:ribose transport system substrate-binding protein
MAQVEQRWKSEKRIEEKLVRRFRLSVACLALAALATCAFVVAGCGSSSGDSSSAAAAGTEGTEAAGTEGTEREEGNAAAQAAEKLVAAAEGPPKFEAPGPAFDASRAKGKSLYLIPVLSTYPLTQEVMAAMKEAAALYDVKITVLNNNGTPAEWAAAMEQAINAKPDAIATVGMAPEFVGENNLIKAEEAGIKVLWVFSAPEEEKIPPHVWGVGGLPHVKNAEILASFVGTHVATPTTHILFESETVTKVSPVLEKVFKETVNEICSECQITSQAMAFNEWPTKLQTAVATELTKDPSIEWVVPIYDVGSPYVNAALAQKNGEIQTASEDGSPLVLESLEKNEPAFIKADAGALAVQAGWTYMDLALRALAGEEPYPNAESLLPAVLFTNENVKERLAEDGYKAEFEKLWSGAE